MASIWKLKAFNWMMQENMNVEEYQTVVSTPLLLLVSFRYASVVRYLTIISATYLTTIKIIHCFVVLP